jgi:hypothetical protein
MNLDLMIKVSSRRVERDYLKAMEVIMQLFHSLLAMMSLLKKSRRHYKIILNSSRFLVFGLDGTPCGV